MEEILDKNTKTAEVIKRGPSGEWRGKIKTWYDKDIKKNYGHKVTNPSLGDFAPGDTIQSTNCPGIY